MIGNTKRPTVNHYENDAKSTITITSWDLGNAYLLANLYKWSDCKTEYKSVLNTDLWEISIYVKRMPFASPNSHLVLWYFTTY